MQLCRYCCKRKGMRQKYKDFAHSQSYTDHASISASTIQLMDPLRSDLGFCGDKQNEEAERLLLCWGGTE